MGTNPMLGKHLSSSLLAGFAAALILLPLEALGAEDGPRTTVAGKPGFRTDVGLQVSFGGSSAFSGGSGYAAGEKWNTRMGFEAGVILRPFRLFSFGLDVGITTLTQRAQTANRWRDLTLGPVARFHLPVHVGEKFYFEPSFGLQTGLVYGVFLQNSAQTDSEHKHYGPFLSAIFGLDFFPIPKVGVGIDMRLLRTFYTTVCFENSDDAGAVCRGTDQGDVVASDVNNSPFLGEKGKASYPWKMFWGVHALYYF